MIITLSGTAGSGKSTVGKLLAKKLGFKHYSMGDFQRQIAEEKNLSIIELGKLEEKDKSMDQLVDKRQIELGKKEDNFVIDARLGFYFIPNSIKIFLDADLKVRAERIQKDILVKGLRKEERAKTLREIIEEIKKREECEKKRYLKYYKIDPYDKKQYDLVVDTSNMPAEEVAEKIIGFVKQRD